MAPIGSHHQFNPIVSGFATSIRFQKLRHSNNGANTPIAHHYLSLTIVFCGMMTTTGCIIAPSDHNKQGSSGTNANNRHISGHFDLHNLKGERVSNAEDELYSRRFNRLNGSDSNSVTADSW